MFASADASVLYATDHGRAQWAPDGGIALSLGDQSWTVSASDVDRLHEATEALAGQVYRCNCDCRWQLRLDDQSPAILGTDEVLQLHSLLSGTVVMLELHNLLDAASIEMPSVDRDGRPTTQA